MREKFLLILMDEELILYKGLSKKIYCLKNNIKEIQAELKPLLTVSPQTPLTLLIDRSPLELREELMPPFWLWDKWRLLYHKKQHWRSQGEVYGYRFYKQDRKTYLQWISVSPKDSLHAWISWIQSLPNPFLGAYFLPLEGGVFIQKNAPSQDGYGLLVYSFSSTKTSHVIFKGNRLLFSRPFSGEEDLKSSLHFLSRTFPDVHEKIRIINLNPAIPLGTSKNVRELNPNRFIHFLTTHKPTTLSLKVGTSTQNAWLKRSAFITFILSLFLIGSLVNLGRVYQEASQREESKIALLKTQLQFQVQLLKRKKAAQKKSGYAYYQYLLSQQKDPFPILTKLSLLLKQQNVRLEKFIWDGQGLDVFFFLPSHETIHLSHVFNVLLASFHKAFPENQVQVMEAPLGSSPQETYKYPSELSHPLIHLRLALP